MPFRISRTKRSQMSSVASFAVQERRMRRASPDILHIQSHNLNTRPSFPNDSIPKEPLTVFSLKMMASVVANSLSRRILARPAAVMLRSSQEVLTRSFGVANKGPHPDPLHLWQQECISRQLCDTDGNRLPGVDWRISIAIADSKRPEAVRRNDAS